MQKKLRAWKPKSQAAILNPLKPRQAIEIDTALRERRSGSLGELQTTNAIRAAFGLPPISLHRPNTKKSNKN